MGYERKDSWLTGLSKAKAYMDAGKLAVAETLWPTRCVLCEAPGSLVCDRCSTKLHYVDQWNACPRCGAPYGRVQCTECNELSMRDVGRACLPFESCVSSVRFDDESAAIVTCHKDAGEQGLADYLGFRIACAIPPGWVTRDACVTPVPATRKARQRRGFDHGAAIARAVAGYLHVECHELLQVAKAADQRNLTRTQRFRNMDGRFSCSTDCRGKEVILVDDVLTTGATLCAASDALLASGATLVRCATFARVY